MHLYVRTPGGIQDAAVSPPPSRMFLEFQIIPRLAATQRQGTPAHGSLDAMRIRGVFRTLLVVQPIGSFTHDRSLSGRPISEEPPLCQCCNQRRGAVGAFWA
jgi:hypothetical protein